MDNESSEPTAREIWQSQAVQPRQFSPEELGRLHRRFDAQIRRRNVIEYLASVVVVVMFGYGLWKAPERGVKLSCALAVVGCVYVMRHLYVHGSARKRPADAAAGVCREYYRADLERQYRLLSSVWSWYIGPFVPSFVVLFAARVQQMSEGGGPPLGRFILAVCVVVVIAAGVGWLNAKAAAKLAERLRALDALEAP